MSSTTYSVETLLPPVFRQKGKKLKRFVEFLWMRYGGWRAQMFLTPTVELRAQLLGVHGIGPETADAILLLAPHPPAGVRLP